MMIRFFHHGDGSGAAAVDYLLAKEVTAYTDDRQRIENMTIRRSVLPQVLDGDPDLTRHLIDSNTRKWRYTSGVIAFHAEDEPSDDQQTAVMRDFEKCAFAGLEQDQANVLWVRHAHMGNVELHFLVPRVELYQNRSFNPAPPGSESYFNTFRDYWNARESWVSPKEPARKRMVKPVIDFGDRKQIKEAIQTLILQKIEAGELHSHKDVRAALEELDGFEFKPLTAKQQEKRCKADAEEERGGKRRRRDTRITMRVAGTNDSQNTFRLEDRIFHEEWTSDESLAARSASEGQEPIKCHGKASPRDIERLRTAFEASVARRAAKNHARYARPRKIERRDAEPDDRPDRTSCSRDTTGDGCIGSEPERVAHDHMENDATDLPGRGLANLLDALDRSAYDFSDTAKNSAGDRFGEIRPLRRQNYSWPWRYGPGSQSSQRRRTRQVPDSQSEWRQSLHRNKNNEVSHVKFTADILRDRIVERSRRVEHDFRNWIEERKRLTDRICELKTRIQSVHERVGETLGQLTKRAGRIAEDVGARLMRRRTALTEGQRKNDRSSISKPSSLPPEPEF